MHLLCQVPKISADIDIQHIFTCLKCVVALSFCIPLGGRTLQILKAKVSDGGKYKCVAINAAGEAQKLIHVTVFGQSMRLLS